MALRAVALSPFPTRVSLALETETWFLALGESGRGLVSLRSSTGVDRSTFLNPSPPPPAAGRPAGIAAIFADPVRKMTPHVLAFSALALQLCLRRTQLPRAAPHPRHFTPAGVVGLGAPLAGLGVSRPGRKLRPHWHKGVECRLSPPLLLPSQEKTPWCFFWVRSERKSGERRFSVPAEERGCCLEMGQAYISLTLPHSACC